MATYSTLHDWNVICGRTGRKYKASECSFDHGRRGMGDTLFVNKAFIDEPQPQDYIHGLSDELTPPIVRPEGQPNFLTEEVNPYEF